MVSFDKRALDKALAQASEEAERRGRAAIERTVGATAGQPASVVEARLRQELRATGIEPGSDVAGIAQRIAEQTDAQQSSGNTEPGDVLIPPDDNGWER